MMAAMKSESDGKHPSSHYLVVEDPDKPSTWHLRVKNANGDVDHGLLGAAWAALHKGYRGNKYDGPDKAVALKKLTALYKSEKMDLPDTSKNSMGEPGDDSAAAVAFAAGLEPGPAIDGDFVVRTGKLFEIGDYPDRDFSFDESDLEEAVSAFTPCPVDLEHVPTVLAGKLGHVRRIFAGDDGTSVMGEVALPVWLDRMLDDGNRKVSATWDRATKTLRGLALVRNPRVSDAALMAAFSAAAARPIDDRNLGDPAFARKRHDTPTGQMSMQRMHDVAVSEGAVCNEPAAMASRHEHSAVQQMHDLAVEHGASCEPPANALNTPRVSSYSNRPSAAAPAAAATTAATTATNTSTKPSRRLHMNIREWLTGKAKEEGVDLDDLDAAFTGPTSDDLDAVQQALTAKDAKIAALEAAQQAAAAAFSRMAEERRQAEAVTFAQGLVTSKRVTPAAAEKLAPLAARIAAGDSVATFAEGEPSTTELLRAFCESLADLSIFSTEQLASDKLAALFNATATEGVSKPKEMTQERKDELLRKTPLGRAILAERQSGQNGK